MAKKKWKRKPGGFGRLRQLPSGNFQASFKGPDGVVYKAPATFVDDHSAEHWLRDRQDEIRAAELSKTEWRSPEESKRSAMTVSELFDVWLANSTSITKESTRQSHRRTLELRVLCDFLELADMPVVEVSRKRINEWWRQIKTEWPDDLTTNAQAYRRMHTAFEYARTELEIITVNPVQIKGANAIPRSKNRDRALISVPEAAAIADNINKRLRVPVLVLTWAGLRIGELLELRRGDIQDDGETMTLNIRRNAQRLKNPETGRQGMVAFDTPKTDAGNRDVVVPPTVAAEVRDHLAEYVDSDSNALFVTTEKHTQMMDTTFRSRFKTAATAAGRPDVSPHDLRRFYGTMLVNNGGVSLEEARRLMGHETTAQLMEYQRASARYEQRAAASLDSLLGGAQ